MSDQKPEGEAMTIQKQSTLRCPSCGCEGNVMPRLCFLCKGAVMEVVEITTLRAHLEAAEARVGELEAECSEEHHMRWLMFDRNKELEVEVKALERRALPVEIVEMLDEAVESLDAFNACPDGHDTQDALYDEVNIADSNLLCAITIWWRTRKNEKEI